MVRDWLGEMLLRAALALRPPEEFPAPREDDCAHGCCEAGDVGVASEAVAERSVNDIAYDIVTFAPNVTEFVEEFFAWLARHDRMRELGHA